MKEKFEKFEKIKGFSLLNSEQQKSCIKVFCSDPEIEKWASCATSLQTFDYDLSFAGRNAARQNNRLNEGNILKKIYEHQAYKEIIASRIAEVQNKLDDNFHFLFKSQNKEYWANVKEQIEKLETAACNEKLIALLNQDWNIQSPILGILDVVTQPVIRSFQLNLNSFKEYFDDIANAHIFYRFFGTSSDHVLGVSGENPRPTFSVIDLYNYHRSRESVKKAFNTWQVLYKPIKPFFDEYVDIAQSETNLLKICFRAFMPFLLLSLVLALGYAAVLPLASHVFIEYVLFIPTLYFSIVIASQYIQIKNYLYLQMIKLFHGSEYAVSNFESNEILSRALLSKDLGRDVAQLYVSLLKEKDKLETDFHNSGSLTSEQMANRQTNLYLKSKLMDEWEAIKQGHDGIDKIPEIVLARLNSDQESRLKTIKNMYEFYLKNYSQIDDRLKTKFKTEYSEITGIYENNIPLIEKLQNLTSRLASEHSKKEGKDLNRRFNELKFM